MPGRSVNVNVNATTQTEKPYKVLLSPEGLDEKIEAQTTFTVTLTQGGKYRVYHNDIACSVHDTLEDANGTSYRHMALAANLHLHPQATLDALLAALSKDLGGSDA